MLFFRNQRIALANCRIEGLGNSLEERQADEAFRGGLELDQVGEEVGSHRGLEGQQKILGLLQRRKLDGQIAVVVDGGEERESLVIGSCSGH